MTIFNGKTHYTWPCSIAKLNYPRVYRFHQKSDVKIWLRTFLSRLAISQKICRQLILIDELKISISLDDIIWYNGILPGSDLDLMFSFVSSRTFAWFAKRLCLQAAFLSLCGEELVCLPTRKCLLVDFPRVSYTKDVENPWKPIAFWSTNIKMGFPTSMHRFNSRGTVS